MTVITIDRHIVTTADHVTDTRHVDTRAQGEVEVGRKKENTTEDGVAVDRDRGRENTTGKEVEVVLHREIKNIAGKNQLLLKILRIMNREVRLQSLVITTMRLPVERIEMKMTMMMMKQSGRGELVRR